jgi:hypothetical protein
MTIADVKTMSGVDFRLFGIPPLRRIAAVLRVQLPAANTSLFILVFLVWVPLVTLSAVDGRLRAGPWPLDTDVAVHARLLVELPALIVGKRIADVLFRKAIEYLVTTGMVSADQYDVLKERLAAFIKARDSVRAAGLLVVAAYILTWLEFRVGFGKFDWWKTAGLRELSLAGYWYYVVARPLVVMQLLWWLWAFSLWVWLLIHLVRLPLRLLAFHPDGVGGLHPALVAHRAFVVLAFGLSTDIAGAFANRMLHTAQAADMYRTTLISFVVVLSLVLVAPLAVVVRILLPARVQAMLEYGCMARELSRAIREKSLEAREHGIAVDTYSLISAHCDSRGGMDIIAHTNAFLLTRKYVLWFVVAAAFPIGLAMLTRLPAHKVVVQLWKLLTV